MFFYQVCLLPNLAVSHEAVSYLWLSSLYLVISLLVVSPSFNLFFLVSRLSLSVAYQSCCLCVLASSFVCPAPSAVLPHNYPTVDFG